MNTSLSCRIVPFVTLLLVLLPTDRALRMTPKTLAEETVDSSPTPAAKVDGFVEPKGGHQPGHALGGWYLGVYGSYTSKGLVLTQVYPRTPAVRAGLEVGDRIIAVNGRQIGVNPRARLTLDVALQRYVGPNGKARLLVHDRRTNRLVNIDVRLVWGGVHT